MREEKEFVRTTLYIHRKLHDEAKIMAVLTHSSMSHMVCIALREKIEQLKNKSNQSVTK